MRLANGYLSHRVVPSRAAVLRGIAGAILNAVRPTDRAARYGGEESAVLSPETGLEGALALGGRIRGAIAETPVAISPERSIRVTASLGVAARPERTARTSSR